MARRISRKDLKKDELVEATVDATHWAEQHWADLIKWAAGAVLLTIVVLGGFAYVRSRRAQANEGLAKAIQAYQELEKSETASFADLETAASRFAEIRGTAGATAKLARFYEGSALLQLGRVDEATTALLEVVGASEPADTLGGTARALLARAYTAAGQHQQARELLEALLAEPALVVPKDQVLLDLADIREREGDPQAAREFLERIVEEHPRGPAAVEARRRLESAS